MGYYVFWISEAVGYSTTRGLHIKNTKTSKPHVVDLDKETISLLQECAQIQHIELSKVWLKVKSENKHLLFPNIHNELMHLSKTSKWSCDVQEEK